MEALAAENPTEEQNELREWLGLWRPEAFDATKKAMRFDREKRERIGHYREMM